MRGTNGEVCMAVEEQTYIPPFGGWCEVCMVVEEHTHLLVGAGVRYAC